MHQMLLAGADFNGPNPAARSEIGGEDEVPIDLTSRSRQLEGALRFEHEIGLTKLPVVVESRWRMGLRGWAFGRAGGHPTGYGLDVFGGQAPLAGEIPIAVLGKPWRHGAASRYVRNLSRVLLYIFIAEQ